MYICIIYKYPVIIYRRLALLISAISKYNTITIFVIVVIKCGICKNHLAEQSLPNPIIIAKSVKITPTNANNKPTCFEHISPNLDSSPLQDFQI